MTGGDRVIRAGLWLSLTVVTVPAIGVSYEHLFDLAKRKGEAGVSAAVLPVTVDGLILATTLVIVRAARDRSRPPVLAIFMLIAGIAATLAGNIAHGVSHGWTGAAVAGWPALVAAGCFHLLIGEIRRGREAVTSGDVVTTESETIPADLRELNPWTDDRPVGMEVWATIATTPEPVATGGPPPVPAIEATPPDEPALGGDSPPSDEPDPELGPVVATARDRFAEMLATGALPSLRAIRRECKVGHPRAVQVREALSQQ